MKTSLKKSATLIAIGLLLSGSANAGLIGDTVSLTYSGTSSQTVSAVVGPGEDGNFFFNQFFDFTDTGFSIRSTGTFCGILNCSGPISLILSSLDMGSPITGIAFSSTLTGVTSSFAADSVTFSWSEQTLSPGVYLNATFNTEGTVPEPGSLALLGLGIAGMAALRRKTKA